MYCSSGAMSQQWRAAKERASETVWDAGCKLEAQRQMLSGHLHGYIQPGWNMPDCFRVWLTESGLFPAHL